MSLDLTEQEKATLFAEFPRGVTYQDDVLHLFFMVIEVLAARGLPEGVEPILNEMENNGRAAFAVRELAAQNVAQAAKIKALEAERITLLQESTHLQTRIWELEAEVKRLTPRPLVVPQDPYPPQS
jgi:hypothetical protein